MVSKIDIVLDSFNKIYKENEIMTGSVEITSLEDINFDNISAEIYGQYTFKNTKANPPTTDIKKFYNLKTKIAENGKIKAALKFASILPFYKTMFCIKK